MIKTRSNPRSDAATTKATLNSLAPKNSVPNVAENSKEYKRKPYWKLSLAFCPLKTDWTSPEFWDQCRNGDEHEPPTTSLEKAPSESIVVRKLRALKPKKSAQKSKRCKIKSLSHSYLKNSKFSGDNRRRNERREKVVCCLVENPRRRKNGDERRKMRWLVCSGEETNGEGVEDTNDEGFCFSDNQILH